MIKKIGCMVMAVLMLLAGCAAAEESIAVRVDDLTYTVDDIQLEYAMQLSMYVYSDIEVTDEVRHVVMENVLESFVTRGLVEKQAHMLGLDRMSENERQQLLAQARQAYDELWQQTRNELSRETIADADITEYLTFNGVTIDWLYRELVYNRTLFALMDCRGENFDVTDEEIESFYDENYVKPYRDRYEGNIPLFENEILIPGEETLYLPTGYRRISQILIPLTGEKYAELSALEEEAIRVSEQMQTIYNDIAGKAIAGQEITEEERTSYQVLKEEMDRLELAHGSAWIAFLDDNEAVTEEIRTRIATGESFASLQPVFGVAAEDITFHPESIYLPQEITDTLLTLEKPGDVSLPCLYIDGIHIFCYEEDMACGAMKLEDAAMREAVANALRNTRLSEAIVRLHDVCRDDYTVEIDRSQLTY